MINFLFQFCNDQKRFVVVIYDLYFVTPQTVVSFRQEHSELTVARRMERGVIVRV